MSNTKEISKKEAIEAARSLKMFCERRIVFDGHCNCLFADGTRCNIGNKAPCDFEIPHETPCRWTEEDYLLADLLRKKDVQRVERIRCDADSCYYVRWVANNSKPSGGWLPDGYFEDLVNNEKVFLEDVIEEYESANNR